MYLLQVRSHVYPRSHIVLTILTKIGSKEKKMIKIRNTASSSYTFNPKRSISLLKKRTLMESSEV
jgi:hypothetical protein